MRPINGGTNLEKKSHLQKMQPPLEDILQFPQIPNAAPYPILITDTNALIYYANHAWEKLTGYTFKEVKGKNPKFLGSGKTPKQIYEKLWETLQSGHSFSTEKIIDKKKNGEEYQIYSTFFPIQKNGEIFFYVQMQHDITERIQLQKRIEFSEKKYRNLVDNASDGILLSRIDRKIIDANNRICEMFGYSKSELLKMNISELISAEDLQLTQRVIFDLKAGRRVVSERKIQRKDGTEIYIEASSTLFRKGIIQSIVRDVTEQKSLQQSNELLTKRISQILDSISDGFYSLDNKWRFTYINKQAEKIMPYRKESVYGKNIWKVYPGRKGTDIYKNFNRSMETQEVVTFKIQGITGKYYKVHCYPSPSGLSVYFNDITLEEEISKRQEEFISIASHEFKTPITSINLYAQHLRKRLSRLHDKKIENLLLSLESQVQRLKELSDDILDTSSIQSGYMKLNKQLFDIREVIEGVVVNTQNLPIKHIIKVNGNCKYKVFADKTRISQVLTNLLTNAIKYSPNANKIVIFLQEDKKNIAVSVQDFGIGIPKEKQLSIFNRFYRTERGEEISSGLGLGLFIANNIIRSHKGKMWVKSEMGKGSTFYFSLPIGKTAAE